VGFQGTLHFALHTSLILLFLGPLSVPHVSRSEKPRLIGKRDDHSRVAIWTECQRMTCSSANPAFSCADGMQNRSLRPRRTHEIYRQCCFVPLSHGSQARHSPQQRGVCNLETMTF